MFEDSPRASGAGVSVAPCRSMNAIRFLKAQHKQVDQLFKQIEAAESTREKKQLFEELAAMLVGHDAIEREIFYPACERKMGLDDVLGEALVEHGYVEFGLYEADEARGKKGFDFRMSVLSEMVKHHVEEEEKDLLPRVEKEMDEKYLELLGKKMQARFDEAFAEDFRGPLHENLRQVLEGALKTSPKKKVAKPNGPAKRANGHSSHRTTH
jgi:hypothetical protein